MSFDLPALKAAIDRHGPVARVCITRVAGSSPREIGTTMLVWEDGQSGTIGGGSLEYEAALKARKSLMNAHLWDRHSETIPLGPTLGQCCGGTVSLLFEVFNTRSLRVIEANLLDQPYFARPTTSGAAPTALQPAAVSRHLASLKSGVNTPSATHINGWFIEPLTQKGGALWIFGAGHVGRAMVQTFHPLNFDITWIDVDAGRFPTQSSDCVTRITAQNPADLVKFAPPGARHLILTYSHTLDFEICHQLLTHGFEAAGLIGSKTKWARFQKRLSALGHTKAQIERIDCPIGQPQLGKSPHAIAIGVAGEVLLACQKDEPAYDLTKDIAR